MIRQSTLKHMVRVTGVGLHTGDRVQLCLRPAPPDTGIVFRRVDLPAMPTIPARIEHVVDTRLATTLAVQGARVATVEHLLAALGGLGVDNALVDLSGGEVPIMDGSAGPFVALIEGAGLQRQSAPRHFLRVLEAVSWTDGDARATLRPHEGLRLRYQLDYPHPVLRDHTDAIEVDLAHGCFARDLAQARTFGFMEDIERLKAMNLARGGSLDNAIVLGADRILNEGPLRYADEFGRHKILDAIGDFALLGAPVLAAFDGYKSGHASNLALLRTLLARPEAFERVTCSARSAQPLAEALPPG